MKNLNMETSKNPVIARSEVTKQSRNSLFSKAPGSPRSLRSLAMTVGFRMVTIIGCSVFSMVSSAISAEKEKATTLVGVTLPLSQLVRSPGLPIVEGPLMPVSTECLDDMRTLQESYDDLNPKVDIDLNKALRESTIDHIRDLKGRSVANEDCNDLLWKQKQFLFEQWRVLIDNKNLEWQEKESDIQKIQDLIKELGEEGDKRCAENRENNQRIPELEQSLSSLPHPSKLVKEEPVQVLALPMNPRRLALLTAVQESFESQSSQAPVGAPHQDVAWHSSPSFSEPMQSLDERRALNASLLESLIVQQQELIQEEYSLSTASVEAEDVRQAALTIVRQDLKEIGDKLESAKQDQESLEYICKALTVQESSSTLPNLGLCPLPSSALWAPEEIKK